MFQVKECYFPGNCNLAVSCSFCIKCEDKKLRSSSVIMKSRMIWSSDKLDFLKEISSSAFLKDPVCSTVSKHFFLSPLKGMSTVTQGRNKKNGGEHWKPALLLKEICKCILYLISSHLISLFLSLFFLLTLSLICSPSSCPKVRGIPLL